MAKPQLYLAVSNQKPVTPLFAKKPDLRLVFGGSAPKGQKVAPAKTAAKKDFTLAPNRHDHYPH